MHLFAGRLRHRRRVNAPEPTSISAGALHLRPWEPYDADAVLAAGTDPLVQRWTQVPVPYTPEHARDFAAGGQQRWRDGTELGFAVCDSTTGSVLANVGLRPGCDEVTWEVGCWTVPEGRGRGVVPEAAAVLARWAFAVLDAQRVEWLADPGNWASRRAAQKAGFTAEGVLRGGMRHRGESRDGWVAGRRPEDPDRDTALLPVLPDLPAGDLVVRSWRKEDGAALAGAAAAEGFGLPGLHRLPDRSPAAVADWWLDRAAHDRWESGAGYSPSVWDGDELVGSLQLFLAGRRQGLAEIGVWTAPGRRRTGVTRAAVGALLDWAVPSLGLVRVEWVASVGNPSSVAVAEALGFVREGTARAALRDEQDRPDDAVLLALVP